jgi:superfamily II DNA or RNA helicase
LKLPENQSQSTYDAEPTNVAKTKMGETEQPGLFDAFHPAEEPAATPPDPAALHGVKSKLAYTDLAESDPIESPDRTHDGQAAESPSLVGQLSDPPAPEAERFTEETAIDVESRQATPPRSATLEVQGDGQNTMPERLFAVKARLALDPTDGDLLLETAQEALRAGFPDQALMYLKRFEKHYEPELDFSVMRAVALAQKGKWYLARQELTPYGRLRAGSVTPPDWLDTKWLNSWLLKLREGGGGSYSVDAKPRSATQPDKRARTAGHANSSGTPQRGAKPPDRAAFQSEDPEVSEPGSDLPILPSIFANIDTTFNLPGANSIPIPDPIASDPRWVRLRMDLAVLSLYQGFDELLCLPYLLDVDSYWYQIETVRKVLKQFRGRVLLADEVGLGKTIEAGMVLKEYLLRGMAARALILTPASMVGQWRQEMETKFGVTFASTYDRMLRQSPEEFWAQPRIIASIAAARRDDHFDILRRQVFDLVIVDEAHHLKNRTTRNWKLVDALQKRFLLLLSATPVQNSLVELYNLLTLLKPGIFKTEKEFRSSYMAPGKPRLPANRDRLRDLMRDVMIRNTRSQVDVKLPPRTAVTMKLEPTAEEAACYDQLSNLIAERYQDSTARQRLGLRHLLTSAGSSPDAASTGLLRYLQANKPGDRWTDLSDRYSLLERGCKDNALLDLIKRNPTEKKIVFVHHLATLEHLDLLLNNEALDFALFHGSMTGPEKDAAVVRFRDHAGLLVTTESGGEGRNLQFANTLINYDLPWNPMAIEQRIGRLHRIGQTRPVFIFNLAVKHTVEEYLLSVLDEKINLFELVVGEIGAILGEMDEEKDFAELVFDTWVETTEGDRASAFERLGDKISGAKQQYDEVKSLDEKLFGDEFIAG